MSELNPLVDALRRSVDRRGAGLALLGALVELASDALAASRYATRARVVHAALHLREGGLYQDFVSLDAELAAEQGEEPGASATAWRLLRSVRAPILIDVESLSWVALSQPFLPGQGNAIHWEGRTGAQLRSRRATHLAALPLRDAGGEPLGMVTLELSCPPAVGRRFEALVGPAEAMQLRVDVATSVLRSLPGAPPLVSADPLLPVLGRTMSGVVETLRAFSGFDETILLRGPTGTGKTHLARWCHERSARAGGPFVTVQLHAVAESLREGELFGWKKGAFTGAVADQAGRVSRAEGGTLFVDEIDKLDRGAQGKLLRLLDERVYSPMGEDRDRTANLRFIVGSNADLEREVAEGRFLEDLYYRVHVLPVEVPPLRSRLDEIELWALHMLRALRPAASLDPEAGESLRAFAWPGNLRQLHSVMVRALAFSRGDRVSGEAVQRALRLEASPRGEFGLIPGLRAAAAAFVRESERRSQRGEAPLDLELTQALRGAVLLEAVQLHQDPREAFVQLGLEERLQGGNHLRTLRRERERLHELCAALGVAVPADWAE